MIYSDLTLVVSLYQHANLFAKKSDIFSWTKKGAEKEPDLNLVYEKKGDILGAISAERLNNRTARINDIAVKNDHRGKGIGKMLLWKIIKILQKKHISKIVLWVHWTNARAIPFYYRFGFEIKKVEKTHKVSYVPDGEDIIHLERNE